MCLVGLCCWRLRSLKCLLKHSCGILLLPPFSLRQHYKLSLGVWAEYMVMSRPTLIKCETHEMTGYRVFGDKS